MDVIVNADDLGINSKVNDEIFHLMGQRLVTSATLIANAPKIVEACARLGEFQDCSFGVHLNVTEFSPLTDPQNLKPLLDDDGVFDRDRIRKIHLNSRLLSGIYEEWCAQIEKLQSLGVSLTHIDSHQHVHTIPSIFPVLKKLQKRYNIRRVRISRNIYGSYENIKITLRIKKALFNFLLKYYRRTTTTQGFTDLKAFCDVGKLADIRYQSVELMVHPGLDDYDDGTDLLTEQWRQTLKFPVKLINFKDIG